MFMFKCASQQLRGEIGRKYRISPFKCSHAANPIRSKP